MEIRALIEKKGRYSKEEIAFIIAEGEKVGVMPPKNRKCSNCWRDMAIEVAYAMRPRRKGLHIKGNLAEHGVVHKGRLIMDADLEDPATLEWMEANQFPKYLLQDDKD
jgi:hypothetical protein